jgi:fermentation-respiration switch protein FrsA (DUF1100 family)
MLIPLVILIVVLVIVITVTFYFFRTVILRNRKDFLAKSSDLKEYADIPSGYREVNWFENHGFETVGIVSSDGLKLNGYYVRSSKPSHKAVLLAHGYGGKGLDMHGFARFYFEELGYSVLAPDDRAHGKSEGRYIGFGWLDRRDYVQWIEKLIDLEGKDTVIVLHGISMGGATVLMTAGEQLPAQVRAVISDCAYTTVKEELSYQLTRMYHLPAFPFLYTTSLLTKLKAGYFFGEASALVKVTGTRLPILFIHGEADTFVPFEMMGKLYAAAADPREKLAIPDAGHGLARMKDMDAYDACVIRFLENHVS